MDLYVATNNKHKASELKVMFNDVGLDIKVHLADEVGGMPVVEESEETLEGNARLKAQALKKIVPRGAWVLADDSGLFVDALNGRPGVHSSRYAGEESGDDANRKKLLKELEGVGGRWAEFVCCFVLLDAEGGEEVFLESVRGVITESERGGGGFGYDPVFIADGQSETFAQIGSGIKNKISHRGGAVRQLVEWLRTL